MVNAFSVCQKDLFLLVGDGGIHQICAGCLTYHTFYLQRQAILQEVLFDNIRWIIDAATLGPGPDSCQGAGEGVGCLLLSDSTAEHEEDKRRLKAENDVSEFPHPHFNKKCALSLHTGRLMTVS